MKIYEKTKGLSGTCLYISPEAYLNHIDYSLDYWSFGVCVYQMFLGVLPFDETKDILNENKIADPNKPSFKSYRYFDYKDYLKFSQDQKKGVEITNRNIREKNERLKQKRYKLSKNAYDFVTNLLDKDLNKRLKSIDKIKNHDFFKENINWSLLENGKIKPPLKHHLV